MSVWTFLPKAVQIQREQTAHVSNCDVPKQNDTTVETLRKIIVFWQTVRLTFQHRDQKFISRVKWRHWKRLMSRMLKHSSLPTVPLSNPFSRTIKFHRGSQTHIVTGHCKTALKLEKRLRVSGPHYCSLNFTEFSLTNSITVLYLSLLPVFRKRSSSSKTLSSVMFHWL